MEGMKTPTITLLAAATALTLTACAAEEPTFTDEELESARRVTEMFDSGGYETARDILLDDGIVVERTTADSVCSMLNDEGMSQEDAAYVLDVEYPGWRAERVVDVVDEEMCEGQAG